MGVTATVKVSAAMARQEFHGCTPEFIRDVCRASCCRSSTQPSGILVTIHPLEQRAVEERGAVVENGRLVPRPGEKRCPFQSGASYLCALHGSEAKPFGCIASPFTLNSSGTLIVRNRYRMLKCYRHPARQLPAYVAFRSSLDLIFGAAESARVCEHLAAGGGDLEARMPLSSYSMLLDNDKAKHA